jgi:putative endonuclease
MLSNRSVGYKFEILCVQYLEKLGYRVLKTNYYSPFGEIDIIAQQGEYIVFVEVKYSASDCVNVVYKLNAAKNKRLMKSALHYMSIFRLNLQPRFDLISVIKNKITHYNNIIYA